MAVIGIGVDVTKVDRIDRLDRLYGDRFLRRIYHPLEIQLLETAGKRDEFLAGRFAGKEAAKKALGEFPGWGIAWNEIYVLNRPSGQPMLSFEGKAARLVEELGVAAAHISISHDGGIAIAQVVLESA